MMKGKISVFLAAVAIVSAAYIVISGNSDIPDAPLEKQADAAIAESGCALCHSKSAALPFYAKIPLLNLPIVSDVSEGLKHFDMTDARAKIAAGKPVDETSLAKIEYAVNSGTMPPLLFRSVHWKSALTDAEKEILNRWIARSRRALNAESGAAKKFENEPVRPITARKFDAAKAKLGEKLFRNKALSGDGTLSCATCHPLSKAGADGLRTSKGIRGQFGDINAPTVLNAVFNARQFWDGRAANLEEQAGGPPMNPVEMDGGSWGEIAKRLQKDAALESDFKKIYPDGFTQKNITNAIAEFEKTLTTENAPFDKYLKGDDSAISEAAKSGYALFKQYNCHVCHSGANLGGSSFEFMGLKADYFAARKKLGKTNDTGRAAFTKDERDVRKFKTPTLRNVELTAPYFHDGSTADLAEAVKIMAKFQTGKTPKDGEIAEIVQFLKSLTGENPHSK